METVHFVKTEDIAEKIEALFVAEKQKLLGALPSADIQHVGATSVSGSITKGDLDINVRVEAKDFEKAAEILTGLYEINQPENWSDGYASFKDDSRDLGVQLTVIGSKDDFFVFQREYLKNHPEKVLELNSLKQKNEGKTMNEYRKEKGKLFQKINSLFFSSDSCASV